jgi:hypothetical protein
MAARVAVSSRAPREGAAMRRRRQESDRFQLPQRLAHRRLAGAELGGDLQLHQAIARLQRAGDDALDDGFLDPVPQRQSLDGHSVFLP